MLRWSYQLVLVALQVALVVQVAPPLARAVQRGTAFGAFPESPLVWVQVAGAVAAIVGTAMALAFPGLALVRHRQRGHCRFGGLPRWAVALALVGGAAFLVGRRSPASSRCSRRRRDRS